MVHYVALYCRLSPRPDGSYEGIDAQERWGRDYAASAWPGVSVRVFSDKGVSAANGDERPEYERFRAALAAGEVAHVWTVEQSRLERREVEWFRLAAELDAAGIAEIHTARDGIVRVRDEVAGIKAVLNAGEVRKLRRRVNDRLDTLAAEGRPAGGRCFGYRHVKDSDGVKTLEIVPDRAEARRDAASKALSGWSLSNIATCLQDKGFRGEHGGLLTAGAVRQLLLSPTAAGLRVHRGRVVGKGNWPPIYDEDTYHALCRKLAGARTVDRADGGTYEVPAPVGSRTARRYLLTGGTVVCGVCKAPLVGTMKQLRHKRRVPYYACHPNLGGKGCVGILGDPLEDRVRDQLLDELDKPGFLEQLAVDDHAGRRDDILAALSATERQRNELAELWATPGELTAAEWRTARRALAEHEEQLRQQLAAVPPPVTHIDITAVRGAWPDMTLDERRELVGLFVDRVTINRAKPGTKGFDPDRVSIEWRKA